jgi:hypothetical protein
MYATGAILTLIRIMYWLVDIYSRSRGVCHTFDCEADHSSLIISQPICIASLIAANSPGNPFLARVWIQTRNDILHLITRFALAKTFGGIVKPICLAAFRLTMNSNFIGCSTGRSAGLAPLRILST